MRIRSAVLAGVVVAGFAIGIGSSMVLGMWKTVGSKNPARFSTGAYAGVSNPGDIRGSYAFSDIARSFDIDVETLGRAFGVSGFADLPSFQAKELESLYGEMEDGEIGTDSLRLFVARYLGLPYTPEGDTLLPHPAIAILSDMVSTADLEELELRSVSIAGLKNEEVVATEHAEHAEPTDDRFIRGKTTFGELRSWGIADGEMEQILGFAPGKDGQIVRDMVFENGMEFGTVKGTLQELVDAL